MGRYVLLLLFVVLQIGQGDVYAQNKKPVAVSVSGNSEGHSVWRKRVMRSVPILPAGDTLLGIEQKRLEPFFTRLLDDLKHGKINAYSAFYYEDKPISKEEVADLTEIRRDTSWDEEKVIDKTTGAFTFKESQNVVEHKFDPLSINNLGIVEEWVYDLNTDKTEIQITEIGPRADIMGEDGTFRGRKTIFWMKWNEFEQYMERPQNAASKKKIDSLIWADYFRDRKVVKDSVRRYHYRDTGWICKVLRNIHLVIDSCINCNDPNLDNRYDSTISELLYNSAVAGYVPAFKSVSLNEGGIFTKDELLKITYMGPDTMENPEIGLGDDKPYIVMHRDFNFHQVNRFYVNERWIFDTDKGTAEMSCEAIAPLIPLHDDGGMYIGSKIMFWMKYADVQQQLRRYNEYNPGYNIEWQIWNDRFNEPKRKYVYFGSN